MNKQLNEMKLKCFPYFVKTSYTISLPPSLTNCSLIENCLKNVLNTIAEFLCSLNVQSIKALKYQIIILCAC